MTSLMFVGGIHGVGKTTFCKSLADKTGYIHVTASQLIKEKNASAISKDSKLVEDPNYNQRLLIAAIQERQAHGQQLIVDGHFTLQIKDGIQKIDPSIFEKINPQIVVVLIDSPKSIAARIAGRDSQQVSGNTISNYQDVEITHAKVIAVHLGVGFYKLTPNDEALAVLSRQLGTA